MMEKIIVCIAKDEPKISEWIDYHLDMGFDRIVVYANDWEHNFNYHPAVDVIEWYGKAQQMNCYNHALRNQQFDWAAFIDCDEYLVCNDGTLEEFLSKQQHSVVAPWRIYGNRKSEGTTVVERFRHWDHDPAGHVKVIVKKSVALQTLMFNNPHFLRGDVMVTANGNRHIGPFTKERESNRLYIKHYYYQDREHWDNKMARGRADIGTQRNEKWEDGFIYNTYYDEPI